LKRSNIFTLQHCDAALLIKVNNAADLRTTIKQTRGSKGYPIPIRTLQESGAKAAR
jgi:hypothetical protein